MIGDLLDHIAHEEVGLYRHRIPLHSHDGNLVSDSVVVRSLVLELQQQESPSGTL